MVGWLLPTADLVLCAADEDVRRKNIVVRSFRRLLFCLSSPYKASFLLSVRLWGGMRGMEEESTKRNEQPTPKKDKTVVVRLFG